MCVYIYIQTQLFWSASGGTSGPFPQLNPPGRNSGGGTWSSSGAGSRRSFLFDNNKKKLIERYSKLSEWMYVKILYGRYQKKYINFILSCIEKLKIVPLIILENDCYCINTLNEMYNILYLQKKLVNWWYFNSYLKKFIRCSN